MSNRSPFLKMSNEAVRYDTAQCDHQPVDRIKISLKPIAGKQGKSPTSRKHFSRRNIELAAKDCDSQLGRHGTAHGASQWSLSNQVHLLREFPRPLNSKQSRAKIKITEIARRTLNFKKWSHF